MKNVILFIVAAAALVADATPSPDQHSQIAALLHRRDSGPLVNPFNPSSISSDPSCESSCSYFESKNISPTCIQTLSCLCSQTTYDNLAKCLECAQPSTAQSTLSAFASSCQSSDFPINTTSTGSSSPNSNTNSTGSTSTDSPSSGNSSSGSGSASGAGSPVATAGSASKSNAGVAGPNAFGAVGLSAVAAAVVMIATLGVSLV